MRLKSPHIKKVYLIGGEGFKEELEGVGLTVFGGDLDNGKEMDDKKFDALEVDEEIKAVV